MRAVYDIEAAELGSTTYDQACAFFTASGEWAESRLAIADCLDMHADDVARIGKRAIAARRALEGLPAEMERAAVVHRAAGLPKARQADYRPAVPSAPIRLPRATFNNAVKPVAVVKRKWNWNESAVNPFAVRPITQ